MKATAVAIIGVVVLLVAIVAFAPASLVDGRLASVTTGRLRVTDTSGTVWDGRGVLTDATGSWRMPVGWTIDRAALARGALAVALVPADGGGGPRGTIDITRGATSVRDMTVDIPARALAGTLPARAAVTIDGTVAITAPAFDWNGDRGVGTLDARWRDARVSAGGVTADLGTVDVALAPKDGGLAGRIANSGGDVRLEGTLNLAGSMAGVEVAVTPMPTAPPQIARVLGALGAPDANGAVRITWRGSLR